MFLLSNAVALFATFISARALYFSAISIPKLLKYEKKAEKAASWSNTAERRLWDTRCTVGAGFIAAAVSVMTSLFYAGYRSSDPGSVMCAWPLCMAIGAYSTTRYMRSFWASKAKIPLMAEYNEAISDTGKVISNLNPAVAAWGLIAVLKLVSL